MKERVYSTKEVAVRTGLSIKRVQQAAPDYAEKIGRDWVWTEDGIVQLEARRGKVGKPSHRIK